MFNDMDSDFDFSKVSFIVDGSGNKQAALLPIELYQQLLALKSLVMGDTGADSAPLSKPATVTKPEFHFLVKHAHARGYPEGETVRPRFIVAKGSSASGRDSESLRPAVQQQREQLVADGVLSNCGDHYLFLRDHCFNSPSAAACIIAGNARSGMDAWVDSEGKSLKQRGYGRKKP